MVKMVRIWTDFGPEFDDFKPPRDPPRGPEVYIYTDSAHFQFSNKKSWNSHETFMKVQEISLFFYISQGAPTSANS